MANYSTWLLHHHYLGDSRYLFASIGFSSMQPLFTYSLVEPSKYLDMQWEPELGKYFTPLTQKMYLVLFLLLDVIMIYWFSMIVRVVIRVIQGKGAEDTRSDDEDDEEE